MTIEYNKGVLEGLHICHDILFWSHGSMKEVRKNIEDKIELWKEIIKDYEKIFDKG